MRKLQVQQRKYFVLSLRHKVVNMWLHGANFNEWQFAAGNTKKVIEFLQASYPKYEHFGAAKSFVYRAIGRLKDADPMPSADPFRDLRGESKPKKKRENPRIVELCDELLSEPKATAPKVQRGLRRHGFRVSVSTIYRIAKDLMFAWTKPWHTDILTSAQKLKRKLFCERLLRMSDEALLRLISRWMFTDEKWWDLVGPAASKYCKGATNMERKMQNQVYFLSAFFFPINFLFFAYMFTNTTLPQVPRNKSKKGGVKKRVYFWGGISWFCKTPGVAWSAADIKVVYRHTKNLCVGTVFQDEDDNGDPCIFRVVQTRAGGEDNYVSYVRHEEFPDSTPPESEWLYSRHDEVKE